MKKESAAVTLGIAALLTISTISMSASSGRVGQTATPSGVFTGTWETKGLPNGPWLFNLESSGSAVKGYVWEDDGLTGPSEIEAGSVEGTRIAFRYRVRSRVSRAEQFFPNLVPPRGQPVNNSGPVTITLTGILQKDTITFTSAVSNANGINPAGTRQGRVGRLAAQLPGVIAQAGALGIGIAERFTVTRSAKAAVAGKVVVAEQPIPRPVFQLRFIDSAGKAFSPVTRDVWNAPPGPQTGNIPALLGSPFDAVQRTATETLPGNPAEFIVRLPPGEYRPVTTGLPNGYVLKGVRAGPLDLTAASLRVAAGSPVPAVTVALGIDPSAPWTSVRGSISNFSTRTAERGGNVGGKALSPPTAIVLVSRAFSEYWITPVYPDGRFEFLQVLPGSYEVRAFPDTRITPAMRLTVPVSANINVELRVPDVKAAPCGGC